MTADPRKWPKRTFRTALLSTRIFFKLPLLIREEARALLELKNLGHVKLSHTMTWKYAELAQLCVRASGEAWRGIKEVYKAPRELWIDTIGVDDGPRHLLQTVSLCGRKVSKKLFTIMQNK